MSASACAGIANVHLNCPTTYANTRMPRDGDIGEFLMIRTEFVANL